jgi:hypothetical protein
MSSVVDMPIDLATTTIDDNDDTSMLPRDAAESFDWLTYKKTKSRQKA